MPVSSGVDLSAPIELDFKSAQNGTALSGNAASINNTASASTIRTWNSYFFERNVMVPASAFRFTAPGIDKSTRTAIRSADLAAIYAVHQDGSKEQLGVGIIDETDTHVVPGNVDYLLTGRDMIGQLVDNSAVDAANRLVNTTSIDLETLLATLIQNTRIPKGYVPQDLPNGKLQFQTNPGETKINALQRYLEFTNCILWSNPNGQIVIGKPNFSAYNGQLILSSSNPSQNNVLEGRCKRAPNMAIRQIVTQLQSLGQVDANSFTINNQDQDMLAIAGSGGGRSVYRTFSYGSGNDVVNLVQQVGNQSGNYQQIGAQLSLREIAKENMKVIDVELVVDGHLNDSGDAYNVDQVYNVQMEDDDVSEDMYVYSCSWELTMEKGMITRLKLCRVGNTIVAAAAAIPPVNS